MKKIFFSSILAIALLSFLNASADERKKVGYRVMQSFQKQYGLVENVQWSFTNSNLAKAFFSKDDQEVSAYFENDGNYVGSTINTSLADLPAKLRSSLKKKTEGCKVLEVIELQSPDENAYYMSVDGPTGRKIYKGYANGYVEIVTQKKLG